MRRRTNRRPLRWAALSLLLAGTAASWGPWQPRAMAHEEGGDPTTGCEHNGRWKLTTNTKTPSATPPARINRQWVNGFGVLIQWERSSGIASGAGPVVLTIDSNTNSGNVYSNTVTNSGGASLTEIYQWSWDPGDCDDPIENKDVTVSLTGSGMATCSVAISGNDGGDSATASAGLDAAGSGTVGGNEIAAIETNPKKELVVRAFLNASRQDTQIQIKGDLKKTKGGGSVGGDAHVVDDQTYQGVPSNSKTITISSAVNATANTNGVTSYGTSLTQTVGGSAGCGNSAFDTSSASITVTANFAVAPKG